MKKHYYIAIKIVFSSYMTNFAFIDYNISMFCHLECTMCASKRVRIISYFCYARSNFEQKDRDQPSYVWVRGK